MVRFKVMSDLSSNLSEICTKIVSEIQRLQSLRPGTVVVVIDGGSGAGKSALASLIENEVDIALIQIDDFFAADIPDSQWDHFSVEERLKYAFNWQRLRKNAIEPLLTGDPARWYAFDFESGMRSDGTYGMQTIPVGREPADVILIDGAYSSSQELADLVNMTILVDVSVVDRHVRLAAREDENFLKRWHKLWDPVEEYYFTHVRPRNSFDLVVKNG